MLYLWWKDSSAKKPSQKYVTKLLNCLWLNNALSDFVDICRPVQQGAILIRLRDGKKLVSIKFKMVGVAPNSSGATPGRARSNNLAGRSTALAPPWLRPAYCFASVMMWRENKNVTISDRFICFILTVKQSAAMATYVLTPTTKKTFLR